MRYSLLLISLAACGGPTVPSPTDLRSQIAVDVGNIVTQTNAASSGSQLPSTTTALDKLTQLVPVFGSSSTVSSFKSKLKADDSTNQLDPKGAIDFLDNQLFTDANYAGDGIYNVPASLVCKSVEVDDQGNETDTIDAQCATKLAQAQLRIRVEEDGDTLAFAVQVDADHDEPLSVSLSQTSVALTVDLDNAANAISALAGIFAETPPNIQISGAATARLDILGAAHAKASLTIDRDLSIAGADAGVALDSDQAFRLKSAAAPLFAIELDGAAKHGSVDVAVGATTVHSEDVDLDLPGLTAAGTFSAAGLAMTNISLGDRTTKITNDGMAVTIDLNPDNGRKAELSVDKDGVLTTPVFDVHLTGDDLGDYSILQVKLAGSITTDSNDNLEVVSGSFAMVTDPASFSVTATAGQCVDGDFKLTACL